ncbi:hypothetical protein AGLY_004529 [Aphis glycines]|uniref:Uncharacterized protein n=1 Tax=Aphis glycines TaxID=307491 RepID=A0A6G0TYU8_APHGL|nr:hypothetical protein AGLY_004529 [Aphis glycines]
MACSSNCDILKKCIKSVSYGHGYGSHKSNDCTLRKQVAQYYHHAKGIVGISRICLFKQNSEWSDECIDFTMIITSQNNASISNFGGGFRWKGEYPWCIIEFSTESIFLYGCNSKTNHCKYLKFSPNVYTTEIFDFYANFFLKCRSNFYEICRKRENLQTTEIFNFSEKCFFKVSIKFFWPNQNTCKFYTKFLICYSYSIIHKNNLNFGVLRPLKHKPPFSPTTGNYILS